MARKFLYFIAICTVLIIAALIALSIWSKELTAIAFVPSGEFVEQPALEPNAYADAALWYSRPGSPGEQAARWQPAWSEESTAPANAPAAMGSGDYAVFFVHPTSYVNRSNWNAPIGDEKAERITHIYLKGMASPFSQAREIWAPRYRQATIGAFMTDAPEGQMAIDLAYDDVAQAYAEFLASIGEETPIVLAGHSQGSLHLMRLISEQVAGTAAAERIVGAYLIGWPISVQHDLPSMGLPACETAQQAGCIVSWSSYAEPADPSLMMEAYAGSNGLDGELRGSSPILCTNPINGTIGGNAAIDGNLGTLVPGDDLSDGELLAGAVPARCDERGILLIGDPPEMGNYVLPGNNYHVYDIPLFWANLQSDVAGRARTLAQ